MTSALERRIEQLEASAHTGAEVERARTIWRAYNLVRDHPEQATEEDRVLAKNWQHAFAILIDAVGELEAAVRASYEIAAERLVPPLH